MRDRPAGGTAVAATVSDVLLLFTRAGRSGLGVTDISRELGLSKAVVHRILQSLRDRDLVSYDAHRRVYRTGPALVALGASALDDLDLRRAALPVLWQLQRESRETATLSALVGAERLFIDQVASPEELKLTVEIGRRFPLHVGASGKAILAFAPPELQEQVLGGPLEPFTAATVTDPEGLRRTLAEIVRTGVSVSRAERSDVSASVAAPLFRRPVRSGADSLVGAIGVCGPTIRMTDAAIAALVPLVRAAAAAVSQRLSSFL